MHKMKDSGVPWIGDMPEHWSTGRIGQLYTERKERVSDTEYVPLSVTMKGVLPQLSTAAKTDAHDDRKLVHKGDFAINSRSDRRGSCGISPYDGSVSLINTILTPRGELHPLYYDWLFHASMFSDEFYKWGHGIVNDLWTTNWNDMKRITVPMPPFEEQARIAAFLDAECTRIDSIIEQTHNSIEEYKKLKLVVITQAVTKGIRPGIEMKDSCIDWIDTIPSNWKVKSVGTLFEFVGGYAFSSDRFTTRTSNQVVRIGNVKDDDLRLTEKAVYIDDAYAQEANSVIAMPNDILFTMTGTKGKQDYFYTLVVSKNDVADKKLYINQRVGCFRAKEFCNMQYFDYLLKAQYYLHLLLLLPRELGNLNYSKG